MPRNPSQKIEDGIVDRATEGPTYIEADSTEVTLRTENQPDGSVKVWCSVHGLLPTVPNDAVEVVESGDGLVTVSGGKVRPAFVARMRCRQHMVDAHGVKGV